MTHEFFVGILLFAAMLAFLFLLCSILGHLSGRER